MWPCWWWLACLQVGEACGLLVLVAGLGREGQRDHVHTPEALNKQHRERERGRAHTRRTADRESGVPIRERPQCPFRKPTWASVPQVAASLPTYLCVS